MKRSLIVGAGLFGVLLLAGGATWLAGNLSLTSVQSEDTYGFVTDSGFSCNFNVGNSMNYYGKQLYVENLNAKTIGEGETELLNPSEPYAVIHYGDKSIDVTSGKDKYKVGDGLVVHIKDRYATRVSSGIYCGQYTYPQDNILAVQWGVSVNVPKDQITADIKNISVKTVGQAEKKVNMNIEVTNKWKPFKVDRMSVSVFGKKLDLDSGIIEKGTHTYSVTTSKDYYDSSKFLVNEKIEGNIQVHFTNPKIPQSKVSGQFNGDGNWRTSESWEPGGYTPSIDEGAEYEGGEIAPAEGPCDIQYLRTHGYNSRDCYRVEGGSTKPIDTQNWMFPLENFKSVKESFTTRVKYCGENATYKNGQCVIDDELHVRGDLCLLMNNYTMMTETLTGGKTYGVEDLKVSPNYFCTKHPVIVTNDGVQTGLKTEPYNKWVAGKKVSVPEKQTYTVFYAVNTNEVETNRVCKKGTLNSTTGNCVSYPSVTHVCSGNSVWSPSIGMCTVQPEVKHVCDNPDARYNAKIDKCVVQVKDNSCPVGSYMGPDGNTCYSEASIKQVCPNAIQNGTVKAGKCLADAKVTLVQQNLVGDWMVALDNTGDAITNFFENLYNSIPVIS